MKSVMKRALGSILVLSFIITSILTPGVVSKAAESEGSTKTGTLNYVLVNESTINTGDTQSIVASVGEDTLSVSKAELVYRRDSDSKIFAASANKIKGNAILFQIKHKDTIATSYTVESIKYSARGANYSINLSAVEASAKYGVNTDIATTPDFYVDSVDDANDNSSVYEVTSLFGSNSSNATAYVNDLEEASAVAEITNIYQKSKKITIALDAGHGGSDTGAVRGKLVERDITGKIVKYCKAELEKYSGVKVITTPRANDGNSVTGRDVRCSYAKSKGANVIISFHINAGGGTGAEVWVPKSGTKVKESDSLARKILAELNALGLSNRGLKNGTAKELGMIKYPAEYGIPGILIEHAFIDNSNDTPFISSDSNLKKLGVADAKGIVKYFGLKKSSSASSDDLYKKDSADISYKQSSDYKKITLTAKNIEKADGVLFAVWGNSKGSSDKEWYKAKLSGSKWTAKFYPYNHKETGKYTVEAYVVRKDDTNYSVGKKTINVEKKISAKTGISKKNDAKGTFKVKIDDIVSTLGIEEVTAKIWNTESKSKTSYTYTAKKQSGDSYSVSFDVKNHKYMWGTYKVEVYIKDKSGKNTKVATEKVELKESDPKATTKLDKDESKATISVTNIPGAGSDYLKSVRYKIWSQKNGKDDVQWFTAKKKSSKYTYSVPLSGFKSTGKYLVEVYAKYGTDKENKVVSTSFFVSEPSADVDISKRNDTAGTFRVDVSNTKFAGGVKKVTVDVWRDKESTKRTYTPSRKDGKYRVNIDAADFGCKAGKYFVRVYLHNGQGKKEKVYSKTIKMTAPKTSVSVSVSKDFYINVSANDIFGLGGKSLEKIQFRVWHEKSGKKSLIKINAKLSGNTYKAKTDVSKFDFATGNYKVEVYGTYKNGDTKKLANKSIKISSSMMKIMGKSLTNAKQLARYYKSKANYPSYYKGTDAKSIDAFCKMYIEECKAEGVRAEIAFAQAMKETGFLTYRGRVPIEANNFSGLGAVDGDETAWATYPDVRTGIRAQIQHLKAYASKEPLNKKCVDDRFSLVTRGSAIYVEWLGISENPLGKGWASAHRYGYSVIDDYIKPLLKS